MSYFLLLVIFVIVSLEKTSLLNFRIETPNRNRVYFDSQFPIIGSNFIGFNLIGKTVSGIYIESESTTGHYLIISEDLHFWDNCLIRYDKGSDITNVGGDIAIQHFFQIYVVEPETSKDRYVSIDANGGGNGLSENTAWTLDEISTNIESGMTVWVKAGKYTSGSIHISTSGTLTKPIKIIGYKDKIDEEPPKLERVVSLEFDGTKLPWLSGSDTKSLNADSRSYIVIKNIQISNSGGYGISISDSRYVHIENVYTKDTGDRGITSTVTSTSNLRVISSYTSNNRNHGIRLSGEYHMVSDTWSVSDKIIGMDYYINIYGMDDTGTGNGNIVINNYINRFGTDSHTGHGVSFKAGGEDKNLQYGLIENNIIINIRGSIELRHHGVKNNVVRRNYIYGLGAGIAESLGIKVQYGASENRIVENVLHDNDACFRFHSPLEEDTSPDGLKAGFNNVVKYNLCYNAEKFLIADTGTDCYENDFIYNTIYGLKNSFSSIGIPFQDSNVFKYNIIQGSEDGIDPEGTYTNNIFYDNNFGTIGTDYIMTDPKFIDAENANFRVGVGFPFENEF